MKHLLLMLFMVLCHVAAAAVSITPVSSEFDKDGGGAAILTSGSGSWMATTDVDWITITPKTTGSAGVDSVVYVVKSFFGVGDRMGAITVSGKQHIVTQSGYPVELDTTSVTFENAGGSGSISVSVAAGVFWNATTTANWIHLTHAEGTGNGTVKFTVDKNGGVGPRTELIQIGKVVCVVTQNGDSVTISPSRTELQYQARVITFSVTALAGTSWTVKVNSKWISVVSGTTGFGDGVVMLAVGENESYNTRYGTVTVGGRHLLSCKLELIIHI